MKTTIFANYGVLAHEKQVIYTATAPHAHADAAEQVTVDIPEDYHPYETELCGVAVLLGQHKTPYLLNEALVTMQGNRPGLRWYEDGGEHRKMLAVINEVAHVEI